MGTSRARGSIRDWLRDRALTIVFIALFVGFFAGQLLTGWRDYNDTQREHDELQVAFADYLRTGHMWEATFENWESEFLQMGAFVVFTAMLIQKGSAESRRPGTVELVDMDPRRFRDQPDAPWPVRRGGIVLRVYEHSLGLAFGFLFLGSMVGHAVGGFHEYGAEKLAHASPVPTFGDYVTSARFWFESFQNWQSEFLSVAAMVWLSVYLRQRGSPELKPVHAPHNETGR